MVFAGNLFGTAVGFLGNLLVMRSLGAGGFGVVIVTSTLLNVLWQLTGRGIDQALVRCIALRQNPAAPPADGTPHADEEATPDAYAATVHQIKLVAGTLVSLAGIALSWPLTRFLIGPEVSAVPMIVAAVCALPASLWGYTGSVLQATGRFRAYAAVLTTNALVRFAIVALLWGTGRMTVTLAVASLGVGYLGGAAVGYAFCPSRARSWSGRPEFRPILYALSVWLTLSSVIHLLYSRLDQLMLSRLCGSRATGVYGAAATFAQLVDLLTASLLTVLLPRVCRETEPGALRRQAWLSLRLSALMALPMLSGFALADPVINRLLGPSYAQTALAFKIILAGAVFNVLTHPLQAVLHARGRTDRLFWMDAGLLLTSGAANFLAIQAYGLIGAAWANTGLRVGAGLILLMLVVRELRPYGEGEGRSECLPATTLRTAEEGR